MCTYVFVHVYIHVCVTLTICTVLSSLARVPFHTLMSRYYCKSEMMLFYHTVCAITFEVSLQSNDLVSIAAYRTTATVGHLVYEVQSTANSHGIKYPLFVHVDVCTCIGSCL